MNIQLAKADILKRFEQVNDESLIFAIKNLLDDALKKGQTDEMLDTSIDKALQQVKEGKVTSHNEVREKYRKWL